MECVSSWRCVNAYWHRSIHQIRRRKHAPDVCGCYSRSHVAAAYIWSAFPVARFVVFMAVMHYICISASRQEKNAQKAYEPEEKRKRTLYTTSSSSACGSMTTVGDLLVPFAIAWWVPAYPLQSVVVYKKVPPHVIILSFPVLA